MKDETSQTLFKKFGVVGAIFVVLGAIIAAIIVGLIAGRIAFAFDVSEFWARLIGFGGGALTLQLLIGWSKRSS